MRLIRIREEDEKAQRNFILSTLLRSLMRCQLCNANQIAERMLVIVGVVSFLSGDVVRLPTKLALEVNGWPTNVGDNRLLPNYMIYSR